MSLFDTIEVIDNITGGPFKDEYQTKDLESMLDTYLIENNKLLRRVIKYDLVPEEERKHPILGIIKTTMIGLEETDYNGIIEMYSSTSTWRLRFEKGQLMESKMTEYYALDPDNFPTLYGGGDCDGPDSDFIQDNEEFDFNPQEYSE
jgi:hypothetical protein